MTNSEQTLKESSARGAKSSRKTKLVLEMCDGSKQNT
jgi:hypothetical protein